MGSIFLRMNGLCSMSVRAAAVPASRAMRVTSILKHYSKLLEIYLGLKLVSVTFGGENGKKKVNKLSETCNVGIEPTENCRDLISTY